VNHASERLINRRKFQAAFHEVNPGITRMINKNDIIFMTTFGNKRAGPKHQSELDFEV
jgi:hypothetical protein